MTEVLQQLAARDWNENDLFAVQLAIEEALVNAIKHGNRGDRRKRVHVECRVAAEHLRIEIRDEGPGFNPGTVPDCTDAERLIVPSGRGLLLMRRYMSRVEFNAAGNVVIMEKQRAS